MNNKDFESIRIRIMQEAYELADRNDSEGYNAIKVMCGDVQEMLQQQREWVGLTDDEIYKIAFTLEGEHWKKIADAIESKLKEKNT